MSNDYFNNSNTLVNGNTALGSDIESKFDAISTAFAQLPGESELIRGKVGFADDGGSANAYTCTMHKAITSYVDDMEVVIKIANANTTEACTINVDSQGVKSIKMSDGNSPAIGALKSYAHLRYDADNGYFVLLSSATHEKRIKTIEDSISALMAGSGCPVSSGDTAAGYLEDKLVGENITITKNNPGGNETLTLKCDWIKGDWVNLTGPYVVNIGVYHNDILWLSKVAFAEGSPIENSEPSDENTDWYKCSGGGSSADMTFSDATTFTSGQTQGLRTLRLSDTKVLQVYADGSDSGVCNILTNQVAGTPLTFSASCRYMSIGLSRLPGTDIVIIGYTDTVDTDCYCVAVDVSGASPTIDIAEYEFRDGITVNNSVVVVGISDTKVYFAYGNTGLNLTQGQVLNYNAGTSFTVNTAEANIDGSRAGEKMDGTLVTGGATAVIAVTYERSNTVYVSKVEWTGSALNPSTITSYAHRAGNPAPIITLSTGDLVMVYSYYLATYYIYCPVLVIMDDSFATLLEIPLLDQSYATYTMFDAIVELDESHLVVGLNRNYPDNIVILLLEYTLGATEKTSDAQLLYKKHLTRDPYQFYFGITKASSTEILLSYADDDLSDYGTTEKGTITL